MVWLSITEPWEDVEHWAVSGDLRRPGSGFSESNHDYEDSIRERLPQDLRARVTFDSEDCEFFAYCTSREDAEAVLATGEALHAIGG